MCSGKGRVGWQTAVAWLSLAYLILCCHSTHASSGDRSNEFRGCLYVCRFNNCSQELSQDPYYGNPASDGGEAAAAQGLGALLTRSCSDECRYHCMWHATKLFLGDNRGTPQFYGKWPFVRVLGLEEPASVLFSLLNLFGHCFGLLRLRTSLPKSAPMYSTWHTYSLVCINAWMWSAVFHARDIVFTERLDYFSAFSMVLYSLYTLCLRAVGPDRDHVKQSVGAACIALFCYHIWYLSNRRFDYGYNMQVNVTVGVCNGVGWLCWCYLRRSRPYVRECVWVLLVAAAGMMLELADFPPIAWVLDAHALWHLCTAPLPIPWYRFVVADCNYILEKKKSDYLLQRAIFEDFPRIK